MQGLSLAVNDTDALVDALVGRFYDSHAAALSESLLFPSTDANDMGTSARCSVRL